MKNVALQRQVEQEEGEKQRLQGRLDAMFSENERLQQELLQLRNELERNQEQDRISQEQNMINQEEDLAQEQDMNRHFKQDSAMALEVSSNDWISKQVHDAKLQGKLIVDSSKNPQNLISCLQKWKGKYVLSQITFPKWCLAS